MRRYRLLTAAFLLFFVTSALAMRGGSSGSASGAIGLLMLFVGGGLGKLFWGNGGVLVGAAIGFVLAILFAKWIAGITLVAILFWFVNSLYQDWKKERAAKRVIAQKQ